MGEGLIGLFTEPGEWMRRNPLGAGLLVMGTSFLILPVVAVTSFASSLYKDYQSSQQKIGDGKDPSKDPTDPTQDGNKVGAGLSNANAHANAQKQAATTKLSSTESKQKADSEESKNETDSEESKQKAEVQSKELNTIAGIYRNHVSEFKEPIVDKASNKITLIFANADERTAFLAKLKEKGIKFTARDPVSNAVLPLDPSVDPSVHQAEANDPVTKAVKSTDGLGAAKEGAMPDTSSSDEHSTPGSGLF
jgi:hypothetical protein